MDQLIFFIQSHASYAPFIIFGLLILSGFNLPLSEDFMIFISALLAVKNPEYHPLYFFVGVMMGAYFSDMICFSMGSYFGPKLWKIKMWAKVVNPRLTTKLNRFFHQYGAYTLIAGRFIPFGVRNALFLTAGLSKMGFTKFAFTDFFGCTLSTSFYFYLYYNYGATVIDEIKQGNLFIFTLLMVGMMVFLFRNYIFQTKRVP